MLLAENLEGYHNLIKLVSAGYTEGFYYKPRIDKELLAQHAKGLDRPEQLPEGRGGRGAVAPAGAQGASRRPAAYRDILGPDNFFLEMQWHGIEEQRIVNSGMPGDRAATSSLPLVCTNDVHYLRESRRASARRPAVHRHRQGASAIRSGCATTRGSSS